MAANGYYLDALQYSTCKNTGYYVQEVSYDGQNQQDRKVYLGLMFGNNGNSIVIGVFADEFCWEPFPDSYATNVLGYQLSYDLWDQVGSPICDTSSSSTDNERLSCLEDANLRNVNNQADRDPVK